jgi:hypothetical protein
VVDSCEHGNENEGGGSVSFLAKTLLNEVSEMSVKLQSD